MTTQPPPPPAWYPDPAGSGLLRYFDGTQWTEHYSGQPVNRTRKSALARYLVLGLVLVPAVLIIGGGLVGAYQAINPFDDPAITYLNHIEDSRLSPPVFADCDAPVESCFFQEDIKDLGLEICDALQAGATGDEQVEELAADPVPERDEAIGRTNAEILVYWAITDICTDQMSNRQDHWRNDT